MTRACAPVCRSCARSRSPGALHAACELGQEIPEDLYNAVARVLVFVDALRRRGAARGIHTLPLPEDRMRQLFVKLMVPIGVVGIIMLLVVPVPPFLLDILIILNIMFALVILLTSMFVKKPLDFSVFPSLLLVATLFRLGLNVASTRLVLGRRTQVR